MKKYSYIHSLHPILPSVVLSQSVLVDWVIEAHARFEFLSGRDCEKRRLKRFALNENQISKRYLECPDIETDWENNVIYRLTKETPLGMDISVRNNFFSTRAVEIFEEIYNDKEFSDHLIHVSCTGYIAPSAPQRYFSSKEKSPAITHAYHMGCYASLPAIRVANALSLDGDKRVDLIHNEMCSLHLNSGNHNPEQIIVQTLFADGHIYYQLSSEQKGFKILIIKESIIPDTLNDMSWIPAPYGMNMTLSREVPNKISDQIFPFVQEMALEYGIDLGILLQKGIFAIHPGGPRIIDLVQKKLELLDHQVGESKKVLYERGNMSSATLPHIWYEILEHKYPKGTFVVSLAFGPGLTVFGSLFEVQ